MEDINYHFAFKQEDFKLHQLMMKRKLEKEKKEKEELDKMTPEEVLVNDDNLIVKGKWSGVICVVTLINKIKGEWSHVIRVMWSTRSTVGDQS